MNNDDDAKGVLLNVATIMSFFAVLLGAIALVVAFAALTTDTELVASVTWVSPSDIPMLEAMYWDNGIVPLCTDMPGLPELNTEVEAVACLLKGVK